MSNPVYKTEEGRRIVESMYRSILGKFASHPFEQLFIKTETAQTHILRFGEKTAPPLVMIHGSVSNSATWLGNIQDFIDRFCIYCVDIPGEPGLSEPVRMPLASELPYKWLSSLLDNLGIEKASFVTMSLGSWYALNFAVRSPQQVRAMSMITTGGIVPAKSGFIFKALFFMMLGKAGQKLLNKTIYHKAVVPPEVPAFQAITSQHFNPVVEPLPIFCDDDLKKITAPVQFFGGDHDALIDSVKTAGRLKSLLPHADIHVLKDTGHVIIDQFRTIRDFLVTN